jgi:hypothetical protein
MAFRKYAYIYEEFYYRNSLFFGGNGQKKAGAQRASADMGQAFYTLYYLNWPIRFLAKVVSVEMAASGRLPFLNSASTSGYFVSSSR